MQYIAIREIRREPMSVLVRVLWVSVPFQELSMSQKDFRIGQKRCPEQRPPFRHLRPSSPIRRKWDYSQGRSNTPPPPPKQKGKIRSSRQSQCRLGQRQPGIS